VIDNYPEELRLVLWAFKKMFPHGVGDYRAEVIQELSLLAMRCRRSHDPSKGKFSTYFIRSAFKCGRSFLGKACLKRKTMKNGSVVLNFIDCGLRFHTAENHVFAVDCPMNLPDEDVVMAANEAYGAMKPRAAAMVKMRMDGSTLREIGKKFGITASRCRQIIEGALVKARMRLEENGYVHESHC
jgi:RNA polymerase sigma factor (sigma-70 family)